MQYSLLQSNRENRETPEIFLECYGGARKNQSGMRKLNRKQER